MIEAHPLHWPMGYPRTERPKKHPHFRNTKTFGWERDELFRQLKLLPARNIIVSSNVPLRQDGIPYANFGRSGISDKGIAVYFTFEGEQKVIACDAWDSFEINLRALWHTVEDIRALERNGASSIIAQVFTGFKALPEKDREQEWWETLGCRKGDDPETIKTAYRNKLHEVHPDKGGSSEEFLKVQEAYRKATP
jgi:hypothetical protein